VQQDKLWQAVLGDIEISLSRGNYLTWFKNTQLLKQDGDKLIIGVPNVFIKQQLERKYNELVTETVRKNGIVNPVIEYKIQSIVRRTEVEEPILPSQSVTSPVSQSLNTISTSEKSAYPGLTRTYRQGLNEKYTFDTFMQILGQSIIHYFYMVALVLEKHILYRPSVIRY
jgi:chromosomal replication initiation ATPase DnaA